MPSAAVSPVSVARAAIWVYALIAGAFLVSQALTIVGPYADEPYARLRGSDFGAFYTVATMVGDGRRHELADVDAQKRAQRQIQRQEETGWTWFNPMPHPPVIALAISPLARLPLRTAYWVWTAGALLAAAVSALLLTRAFCPRIWLPATIALLGFRPIWLVAWWGQIDSFILVPVALGAVLLLTPGDGGQTAAPRRDLCAGLCLGFLALRPQFVLLPLAALLLSRRSAAFGLIISGAGLAALSIAVVGWRGAVAYIDLWRLYGAASPFHTGIAPKVMFNIRGALLRFAPDLSSAAEFRIVVSLSAVLAVVALAAAARGTTFHSRPDLAFSLILLVSLLTSYHTHQQSMVFLLIPLAVFLGRAFGERAAPRETIAFGSAAAALHGASMLSPEVFRQTTVTFAAFAVVLLLLRELRAQPGTAVPAAPSPPPGA